MVKILKTVFNPPMLTHTIRREGLLARLRQRQEKRIVLLKAGSGYGKTVLAASYYEEVKQKVWISIPRGYFSFFDLLIHLTYALDQLLCCQKSQELQESAQQLKTDELIVQILNLLTEEVNGKIFIFIDDLHHLLFCKTEREKMVEIFFSFLPVNTQVILTSHNDLPFPVTRFGQLGEFYQIEERSFMFTLPETRELLLKYGITPTVEDLHQIDQIAGGWISVIILLINELHSTTQSWNEILQQIQKTAVNYLDHFVTNLPVPLQTFLEEVSIFEYLNPDTCNQYLQRTDSLAMLNRLLDLNFVYQLENGCFGMHQLLKESLQARVVPDLLPERYRRLAQIALSQQDLKAGIFYLIKGKQIVEAVQLILKMHDDRVRDLILMQHWLELIPEEYFEQNPLLYFYRGQVKEKVSLFREALQDYELAERLVANQVELETLHIIGVQIIGIYWHLREFEKVILMSQSLLPAIKPEEHKTLALLYNLLGTSCIEQQNRNEGIVYLNQALKHCRLSGVRNQEAWILNNLCYWEYIPAGEFPKAFAGYQEALQIFQEDQDCCGQVLIYSNLGNLYWQMGEVEKAKEMLTEVEQLNVKTGNYGGMPAYWILQARVEIYLQQFRRAEQLLKQISDPGGLSDFLQTHLFGTYSYLYTLKEDFSQALYWIEKALNVTSFRSNYMFMDFILQKIQIKFLQQEYDEVLQLIPAVKAESEKWGYQLYLAQVLFFEGVVQYLRGERILSLRRFVELIETKELTFLLAKYSFLTNQVAGELSQLVKETGQLQERLVSMDARTPRGRDHFDRQDQGQILHFHLFGEFCIRRGTTVITQKDWVNKKALNLLKYLILNRGRLILQDHVLELFWPDLTVSKARQNMYVAINVIRKTLEPQLANPKESHYIISQHGYCKFNTQYPYWLDLDDFENYYAEGNNLRAKQYDQEALEYFLRARTLFKQGFIRENMYDEWCMGQREEYLKMYVKILQHLFEYHRKDEPTQALEYGLELHALDPYLEEANQAVIRLMVEMGNVKDALEYYERLKELYKSDLAMEVPESIQLLVKRKV